MRRSMPRLGDDCANQHTHIEIHRAHPRWTTPPTRVARRAAAMSEPADKSQVEEATAARQRPSTMVPCTGPGVRAGDCRIVVCAAGATHACMPRSTDG